MPAYPKDRADEPPTQDQSPKREQDRIIYSKVVLPWLKSRPEKTLDILSLPGEAAVWEHGLVDAMNREGIHKTLRVYGVERSPELWRKLVNSTSHLTPDKAVQFQNRANLLVDSGITTEEFTEVTCTQKLKNAGFDVVYYDGSFKYKPSEFDTWVLGAWKNNLFAKDFLFGFTYCLHRTKLDNIRHLDALGKPGFEAMFRDGYSLVHDWEKMEGAEGSHLQKTAGVAQKIAELMEEGGQQWDCEVTPSYLATYKNQSITKKGMVMCTMWFQITRKEWGFERVSPFNFQHPEDALSSLEEGLTMDG